MEDAIKNLNQDIHLDAGANRIAARSAGNSDWTPVRPTGVGGYFYSAQSFLDL